MHIVFFCRMPFEVESSSVISGGGGGGNFLTCLLTELLHVLNISLTYIFLQEIVKFVRDLLKKADERKFLSVIYSYNFMYI